MDTITINGRMMEVTEYDVRDSSDPDFVELVVYVAQSEWRKEDAT